DDTIGLGCQLASPSIDNGQDSCTTRPCQVDRAVGVGGGATLANGNNQCVAHVKRQTKARQLSGGQCVDAQTVTSQRAQEVGQRAPGNCRRALTDYTNALQSA
ncbi:MAG: hypothetical protein RL574_1354, partial [Actinomycetota bacterium]